MSDRGILWGIKEYVSGSRARAGFMHEHWEVHQGKSFATSVASATASLASGSYIDLGFKTPDDVEIHMAYQFVCKEAAHLNMYKNCNWSGMTGTLVPVHNRFQGHSNVASVLTNVNSATFEASGAVMKGMSGFSGALTYQKWSFGSRFAPPESTRGRQEIILNTGTQYCFRLYSDAASNSVQLEMDWYEEDI